MAAQPIVPIAFKQEPGQSQTTITILAADIGGTKINVALYRADGNGLTSLQQKRYISKDYTSLSDIIHDFTGGHLPERIFAALAGPLCNRKGKATNRPRHVDRRRENEE